MDFNYKLCKCYNFIFLLFMMLKNYVFDFNFIDCKLENYKDLGFRILSICSCCGRYW